jgi:hypothetical protein
MEALESIPDLFYPPYRKILFFPSGSCNMPLDDKWGPALGVVEKIQADIFIYFVQMA